MRIFRLVWTYLHISITNELQYRANFFIQLFQSLISLLVGLIGIELVFSQTTEIAGWTKTELLTVLGVYMLMGGIIHAYIEPNMLRLMFEIQEGSLDFALTKPMDSQVIVSLREFHLWSFVDVALGLIILGIAVSQNQVQIGLLQGLAFMTSLLLGAVILYCFWLMLSASAFWFIRVGEIAELFEGIYSAGRWPVSIYPKWLRFGLTFIIPVAFAVTIPTEALTNRLSIQSLVGAFLITIVLLTLTRVVWKLGTRNYSGASS